MGIEDQENTTEELDAILAEVFGLRPDVSTKILAQRVKQEVRSKGRTMEQSMIGSIVGRTT